MENASVADAICRIEPVEGTPLQVNLVGGFVEAVDFDAIANLVIFAGLHFFPVGWFIAGFATHLEDVVVATDIVFLAGILGFAVA